MTTLGQTDANGKLNGGRITATLLSPAARLQALPRHFGPLFTTVENCVYDTMRHLCAAYRGDFWDFYELSNGGFYMVPTGADHYRLFCPGNGYEGTLSAEATGLAVCAMAYSQLSFWPDGGRIAEDYYRLRDYIATHAAVRQLYDVLD
ncbi:antirestriction protein [Duganella sp. HH101]|uniref:antirestriction protein n=1 Tax=Duganella sp. HH101 TaxID=1781066 RepID=UPI0008746839|nr:antirestriction protein [Duganella sp. HH101]OFA00204.1 antirestriction protein KlcA [Duganella sp. HH101]